MSIGENTMKQKISIILGIYDLALALLALYSGFLMIHSGEIFSEYPVEFASKLPFSNWTVPGIIMITVFGIGNMAAACFSLIIKNRQFWLASAITGGLLLLCVVCQILIIEKWYLATAEFLLFSILQLTLSGISLSLA
jgi:hypothetical protein